MVKYFQFRESRFGFTLIEILITISLLALLMIAGFSSYVASQQSARDARRKTDLETLRQGLELYKSTNNSYPIYTGYTPSPNTLYSSLTGTGCGGNPCLSATSYPKDPQVNKRYYYQSTTGATYEVCAFLERALTSDDRACSITVDCDASATTSNCIYGVTQP